MTLVFQFIVMFISRAIFFVFLEFSIIVTLIEAEGNGVPFWLTWVALPLGCILAGMIAGFIHRAIISFIFRNYIDKRIFILIFIIFLLYCPYAVYDPQIHGSASFRNVVSTALGMLSFFNKKYEKLCKHDDE